MRYRVLANLRQVEFELERISESHPLSEQEMSSIDAFRSFRHYLERLPPHMFDALEGLISEIFAAVELLLSSDPADYERALVLLEAAVLVNNVGFPGEFPLSDEEPG